MIVTFNETQYEFKTFWNTNGYEAHLFRNGKILHITPIGDQLWSKPSMMFDFYIGILKKYVEFDSVIVNK